MSITSCFCMNTSAAQFLLRNFFSENRLNYVWTGNKHFGDIFNYKNEIGKCRRIYGTTGTRTQNNRYLWNNAGSHSISIKYFTITCQSANTLLNTSSTGIINSNTWHLHLQSMIHYFCYFTSMLQSERTSHNCKVLSIYANRVSIYRTNTGNNTISG